METGAWMSWITMIVVVLTLLLSVWPRIRLWATKREVLLSPRLWAFDPQFEPPRRKLPDWCWALQKRLVPRHHRESMSDLVDLVHQEVLSMVIIYYKPSPDSSQDVREIAAYVHAKRRQRPRRLESER